MSTTSQFQEEWTPATPVSSRTVCRILARNGLHGRIAAQKPALNKRQRRNRVAYAKAHSLTEGWTAEKWQKNYFSDISSVELHPKSRNYGQRPYGLLRRGGKIMVWSLIQVVPGRRWMVTLIVPNINRSLHPSTFLTTRGVRFFNRMELLAIPQVPL